MAAANCAMWRASTGLELERMSQMIESGFTLPAPQSQSAESELNLEAGAS